MLTNAKEYQSDLSISPESQANILSGTSNSNQLCLISSTTTENIDQQIWQLWRWKPPVQSSLQSRDDYFHNPASTPHAFMNEFKKHLVQSKDLKFKTNDLRYFKNFKCFYNDVCLQK